MVTENVPGLPESRSARANILVIEDEPEIAQHLGRQALDFFNSSTVLAGSLAEAEAVLNQGTPRVVLLDMLLPDGDGTEIMLRLQRDGVPAVAVISAAPSLYRLTVAVRTGAADFLVKPFSQEQLTGTFERLAHRLTEHDRALRLREEARMANHANDQLRMKVDILCRDLVSGYQKLFTRLHQHDR